MPGKAGGVRQAEIRNVGIRVWARGPAAAGLLALVLFACSGEVHLEPGEAGVDYRLQGEYRGADAGWAVQVVALGSGRFRAVLLGGGLPGEGFDGKTRHEAEGRRKGERIEFAGAWRGSLESGRMSGLDPEGQAFALGRVIRLSPSAGAPAPAGALALFDGAATEHLGQGSADSRGLLAVPARSAEPHADIVLHLEFRTPFMPGASGQGRGNSGVYLQGRYEVQVLDSFGLPPDPRGAGAIYEEFPPRVNMSYPPLQWQTYDIEFEAARFGGDGKKARSARVTVRHNGVVIHEGVELPGPTGLGEEESREPGVLLLQDHWDPVFYRNVWMAPRGRE